jgi:hypothetical protein
MRLLNIQAFLKVLLSREYIGNIKAKKVSSQNSGVKLALTGSANGSYRALSLSKGTNTMLF